MKIRTEKRQKTGPNIALCLKCGAVLLFFLFSTLIVACGGGAGATGNANTTNLNAPAATVTIRMGNNASPTPPLPPLWCGAWVTQSTPSYNNGKTMVAVYAKFTRNVNGNPVGIGGATATANILWGDGSDDTQTANTTDDGLATFFISTANKGGAINKGSIVTVSFTKPDVGNCTVDQSRAAFFTLIVVSPTAKSKKHHGG